MAVDGPVLLVEDEVNDAILIGRAFKLAGVERRLIMLSDGQQAVNYLRGYGPYGNRELYPLPVIMLLDLDLPILDGFQVLERVRADPGLDRLPVIVLTASVFSPDVNRAYKLGANSFLIKPTNSAELAAMVKATLDYWLGTCELPTSTEPIVATLPSYTTPDELEAGAG